MSPGRHARMPRHGRLGGRSATDPQDDRNKAPADSPIETAAAPDTLGPKIYCLAMNGATMSGTPIFDLDHDVAAMGRIAATLNDLPGPQPETCQCLAATAGGHGGITFPHTE